MDRFRGTGRTTRAIAGALLKAALNPNVTVCYVVHNVSMRGYARDLARSIAGDNFPRNFEVVSREDIETLNKFRYVRFAAYYDHFRGQMRVHNSAEALLKVGKLYKELNHNTCSGGNAVALESAIQLSGAVAELIAALSKEETEVSLS